MGKQSRSAKMIMAAEVAAQPVDFKENPFLAERRTLATFTSVSSDKLLDNELSVANKLMAYMEAMTPGKMITPAEGARHQKNLFSILLSFLSTDRDRFDTVVNWLLKVIRASRNTKGVFGDIYIQRFHSQMDLAPAKLRAYCRLLNLLVVASGISDRRILSRRVDLDSVIDSFQDAELKDKLLIFFGNE